MDKDVDNRTTVSNIEIIIDKTESMKHDNLKLLLTNTEDAAVNVKPVEEDKNTQIVNEVTNYKESDYDKAEKEDMVHHDIGRITGVSLKQYLQDFLANTDDTVVEKDGSQRVHTVINYAESENCNQRIGTFTDLQNIDMKAEKDDVDIEKLHAVYDDKEQICLKDYQEPKFKEENVVQDQYSFFYDSDIKDIKIKYEFDSFSDNDNKNPNECNEHGDSIHVEIPKKEVCVVEFKCAICFVEFLEEDSYEKHMTTHEIHMDKEPHPDPPPSVPSTSLFSNHNSTLRALLTTNNWDYLTEKYKASCTNKFGGPLFTEFIMNRGNPSTTAKAETHKKNTNKTKKESIAISETCFNKRDTSTNTKKRRKNNLPTNGKPEACILNFKTKKANSDSAKKQTVQINSTKSSLNTEKNDKNREDSVQCKNDKDLSQTKETNTKKLFLCELCRYKGGTKQLLMKHMKIHTKKEPYVCDICCRKFENADTLNSHKKTVHIVQKYISCKFCSYKYAEQHLRAHMRSCQREQDNIYKCSVCDFKGNINSEFIKHMATHNQEPVPVFTCDVCDFKSATKENLIRHMVKHGGVNPYSCTYCGYKCASSSELSSHRREHIEKPYSCSVCRFSFKTSYALTSHMVLHTGEKPYFCSLCPYKGARLGYLKAHMKTHKNNTRHKESLKK